LGGHILFLGSRQFPGENQQNREKSAVFWLKKEKIYALNLWQGWIVKNAEKKIILTLYTPGKPDTLYVGRTRKTTSNLMALIKSAGLA